MIELEDLLPIPVMEAGEPLVRAPIFSLFPTGDPRAQVRLGVATRLEQANALLPPDLELYLAYGYRSPITQAAWFAEALALTGSRSLAHRLIAAPEVAGHPTGGAIDVTLVQNGAPLDMGGPMADLDHHETFPLTSASGQALANRQLLRTVMMRCGFAPFDGEWWHFSYGDREWAAFYGRPHALYSPIP